MLEIIQVIPMDDYTVYLYVNDGTIRLYDAKPLIQEGGVFLKLKDKDFFMNRCTVLNNTLAWDLSGNFDPTNCIDICPDLFENCPIIKDVQQLEERLFA